MGETYRTPVYGGFMEPCDRLRKARADMGLDSPKEASDRYGWSEHTYKSHENGRRGIRPNVARKYAEAFGVTPSWLLTGETQAKRAEVSPIVTVPLYGDAAGGVWLENDEPVEETAVLVSPDPRYGMDAQYARRVRGNSVSNRIASGEYALVVRHDQYPGGPRDGDLVDVERFRSGLREHTIKVYRGDFLESDCADLDVQETLSLTNGETDTEVAIVGIVVGAFRQF